jgi:hypothetical protein
MAKAKDKKVNNFAPKKHIKHPGIHAKSKTSTNKTSKNYKKPNVGQGK